jgi:hypothetical protein
MLQAIGGLPELKSDPRIRVTGEHRTGRYTIERLLFDGGFNLEARHGACKRKTSPPEFDRFCLPGQTLERTGQRCRTRILPNGNESASTIYRPTA